MLVERPRPSGPRQTAAVHGAAARRARDVGGDVVSAGGTGTYDLNTVATEIQAGSYALMDTAYAEARPAVPRRRCRCSPR